MDDFINFSNLYELLEIYQTNLNSNSIKFEKENYFVSQLKYEKIPIVGKNVARFLYLISYIVQPKNILEIGFGSGYSSYAIYNAINDKKKLNFISLERNYIRYERGIKFIKSKGLNIKLYFEDFDELVLFFKENILFDFVFVDSVKKNYLSIFFKIINMVRSGGIIIFDNIFFDKKVIKLTKNNIPKYCDTSNKLNYFNHYISKRKDIIVNFINIDDGIALCIKK